MSVKIRLQRRGRKQRPLYHIIIADARSPRDGKFIEKIGVYNPLTKPATIELDRDRAFDWLMKGAEPTDTVRAILRFKGVMYRKHLSRGVTKGAFTQEEADAKYAEWLSVKEADIEKRRRATTDEIAEFHAKRSGKAKEVKPKAEEVEAAAPAEAEAAPATEDVAVPAEEPAPAEESTPATEETTPAVDEAPEATAEEATPAEETATPEAPEAEVSETGDETTDDSAKDQ